MPVDRQRPRTLPLPAHSFFVGDVIGALGLKNVGYLSTVPLALLLTGFAEVPAVDDPSALLRRKAGC